MNELFINEIKDAAIEVQNTHGIYASISIAQAILESGWGTSTLAQKYFNLYGIKALRDWSGKVALLDTKEFKNNFWTTERQPFRVYSSWSESIEDHALFLKKDWYVKAGVFKAANYLEQIKAIIAGGYCSAPGYIEKIIEIVKKYNLNKFNKGEIEMNIIDRKLKFKSLTYGNNPKMVLLHHAEWSNCSVEDIHHCHIVDKGWSGIGYHYFVRKDGSIYKGRPDNAKGAHCKGHNTNTLGICAEGDYMKESMPAAQKQAIISLCIYLKNKYPGIVFKGHKEAPYSTNCPGVNYPLAEIKNAVNGQATTVNVPSGNLDGRMAICTGNGVRVRSSMDTSNTSNVIGKLNKGDKVKIFKKCGDWYHTYYGQHGGYVSANYISLI
ncbi:glucosaminidase domain-containing protein [Clostridium botulinum]|uniref:glucosaminidase domain-containing protein n=1 Tax=Clostridium botulinum TaxID=1491 RepID=UPI0004D986D4|nr:glucosaminidase domain-containing protein [Clostridium botulinum]KEH90506.1 peptidoglycan hydrolase [Clostridium botulinum C/D str. It1]